MMPMNMMRRTTFLSLLAAAAAGYLIGRKELRRDLLKARNGRDALKKIGTHVSEDASALADDVRDAIGNEKLQKQWTHMRKGLGHRFHQAQKAVKDTAKTVSGKFEKSEK